MARFALTIFLGAFLLFQVQPILGRFILPWFGGATNVWTTCMLFFQVALLAGYGYAHLMIRKASPVTQLVVHLAIIGASIAFLPITPAAESWRQTGAGDLATGRILLLLATHIGVPYLLLASTGPLLQSWFDREFPGRSPYRLYSLSNLASLLALVSYPFIFEPWLALKAQGLAWTIGFFAYALLSAWCAVAAYRAAKAGDSRGAIVAPGGPAGNEAAASSRPAVGAFSPGVRRFLWIALSAVGSAMLIATTNQVCQDLASVPMLWVFPLAVYLITFIICFDADRWYHRAVFGPLLVVSVLAVNYVMHNHITTPLWQQITAYGSALLASCMICHGELVRLRPATAGLTGFYLCISLGGALGGVWVALVAPLIFRDYWEYHLGLVAACTLAAVCIHKSYAPRLKHEQRIISLVAHTLVLLALTTSLGMRVRHTLMIDTLTLRGFYGVVHVVESKNQFGEPRRVMTHGQTTHGLQFTDDDKRRWPTTYYGPDSGVGLAIEHAAYGRHPARAGDPRRPVRIGGIGLGVGTIAAHAAQGDLMRFYEINPQVEFVARNYFSFLFDTKAQAQVVIGDARVMLERERDENQLQHFDVLAVDAFNSDSIPLHLITQEAMAVYLQHMKPDGLLAFHITNNYVDLRPVLRSLAKREGLHMMVFESPRDEKRLVTTRAVWVVLTRDDSFVRDPDLRLAAEPPDAADAPELEWTDDFASLWSVMKENPFNGVGRWSATPNQGRFVEDIAELLTPEDERQITYRARRLYAATGKKFPLMVVTVRGKTRQADGTTPLSFDEQGKSVYRNLFGVQNPLDDTGILLLLSLDDKQFMVQLGEAWDRGSNAEASRVLNNFLLPGLAAGRPSQAITATVEALEAMARREHARRTGGGPVRE